MKLTDRGMDVLIGVILGATIGLHYPLDSFKLLFVILSVVGVLKLAVKKAPRLGEDQRDCPEIRAVSFFVVEWWLLLVEE